MSTRCHTAGQCDAAVKLALERGVSFEQALEAIDLDNMQGGPSGFYQPNRPLRRTSGSGGGVSLTSACGGGGDGAGRVSHFIE